MNPVPRLPLPAAHADPAFVRCLMASIEHPELIEQWERLYGVRLVKDSEEAMRQYVAFIHDCVYLRLPDEAIVGLRIGHAGEVAHG